MIGAQLHKMIDQEDGDNDDGDQVCLRVEEWLALGCKR